MRRNSVKATLDSGGVALGTMVFEFKTPGIGNIAANAGADFVLFDTEHSGGQEKIAGVIAAMRSSNAVPLVRIAATSRPHIAAPLDAGAMGLMIPMVENADQARAIVDAAKYPPLGRRGAAFALAHDDYLAGDPKAKMQSANDELLLIAQIETEGGLRKVEDIAAIDGIDVLWIGQFDLTNSLGIPAEFDHPTYNAALDRCVNVARRYRKSAGFMASSVSEALNYIERGFRCVAYSGDLWIYGKALGTSLNALRSAISSPHPPK